MATNWKSINDLSDADITPMLRQYLTAKSESGESLLFFRMGDFYELFFEDALDAATILGIAVTSRDAVTKDDRIPMAGVPVRSVESYIARCIKSGRNVTICEQVEDPKTAKGVVKRQVVRTITPGTVIEPELLDESANNYLAALFPGEQKAGLAFVDVTTGEFIAAETDCDSDRVLADELMRLQPVEVLFPDTREEYIAWLKTRFDGVVFASRSENDFDTVQAKELLMEHFGVLTLKGFGLEDAPLAISSAGAVLSYVLGTQRDNAPRLRLPKRYFPGRYVVLDSNTQRNLELTESLFDRKRRGTLLSVLDKTLTSMGGRKMRNRLLHPLLDVEEINARLNAVEVLRDNTELRLTLREALRGMSDLERLLGRLSAQSGNARDMHGLGASLERLPSIRACIASSESGLLCEYYDALDELQDVAGWIREALVDEPPLSLREGGMIRDGYHEELDHLHALVRGGKDWIAALQKEECARTGISNLKIGYNKVFGYFIEVNRSQTALVPSDYERKQTLVNAERYITPGLKSREEEILHAEERMTNLEYDLFVALRNNVAAQARRIQDSADIVAELDVLLALSEVAAANHYVRPIVDDSGILHIREGRHAVVETLMKAGEYVPNDLDMNPESARFFIVTGPNMAGKSTFLRQTALITLMAQIGSFVPATEAHIGVTDRIFTRVGASDNLARGESTFMVEMIETANILNAATERSLIVLDEIGRGTSTFDGISIAWSVAEHIHDHIRAKTLFATHYHELIDLGERLEHAKNVNVAVREWGGKVVFLYHIAEGGADHSYGIHVARLAGLPPEVLDRARDILESLESGTPSLAGLPQQMLLFDTSQSTEPSRIERELETIEPDELSPKEAQDFLYHLKRLYNEPRKKRH